MTGSGVESPSHWISRESGSTPLGTLTLHVSVYEVPTTPDPSPDTTTTGGATGTTIENNSYTFTLILSLTYQGQQVLLQDWVGEQECLQSAS